MGRLIDADKLKEHYAWWSGDRQKDKEIFDQIVDLQPTCNQLATDCINRQDAIAAVEGCGTYILPNGIFRSDALYALKKLPSAQPERNEELLTAITKEAYDQGYNDGTVDAKTRFPVNSERKKGKWMLVKGSNGKDYHKCSECLHTQDITGVKNYCAVCGADMRGDTE